jgi:hypothetical protein
MTFKGATHRFFFCFFWRFLEKLAKIESLEVFWLPDFGPKTSQMLQAVSLQ